MFTSASGRLQPAWSFLLSAALSAITFLVCGYLADVVAGDHLLRFELLFRPLLALSLFGIYMWLLTVADQAEKDRTSALGFPRTQGWQHQLAAGCLLGLALTVFAIGPIMVWATVSIGVRLNSHSAPRIVAVLIVLISGALAEELMFRGYPFQRLEEAVGPVGAISIFSVLFGAVHATNPGATPFGLINTVVIGVVLAIAYLRTRALWLPWGLHFGWNISLGLVFGLPVSGLRIFNVVIHTAAKGPRWLTGGDYGVEASLPGAVAVLAGLLIVWRWPVARLGEPLTFQLQKPEDLNSVTDIQQ